MSLGAVGALWVSEVSCVALHHATSTSLIMGYAWELPTDLFCLSEVALVLLILSNKWADNRSPEHSQHCGVCLGESWSRL